MVEPFRICEIFYKIKLSKEGSPPEVSLSTCVFKIEAHWADLATTAIPVPRPVVSFGHVMSFATN